MQGFLFLGGGQAVKKFLGGGNPTHTPPHLTYDLEPKLAVKTVSKNAKFVNDWGFINIPYRFLTSVWTINWNPDTYLFVFYFYTRETAAFGGISLALRGLEVSKLWQTEVVTDKRCDK